MYREGESREHNIENDAGPVMEGEVINENIERDSNPEKGAEQTPEALVGAGISLGENKDATDAVISSEWVKKAKAFFETRKGKVVENTTGIVVGGLLVGLFKGVYVAWKFAETMIKKGGKMSYADGVKIAEDAFSISDKKK